MFVGPKEIKKFLNIGGKDDIPAKLMDLKDVASTQLHPNTKENDGNWRYNITPNEEKWTIFPIHCDINSIETTLGKYKFFSHSSLRLKGKKKNVNDDDDDDNDSTVSEKEDDDGNYYYLPYCWSYRPFRGWLSYASRKDVFATDYLTHDHLQLFLSIMSRNYQTYEWKNCAFVPWSLCDNCKKAAPLQLSLIHI